MLHRSTLIAALFVTGLCGPVGAQAPAQDAAAILRLDAATDWRGHASPRDRERLGALGATWAEALENVRDGGQAPAVAALGTLADSRPGREGAQPPAGAYRCRSLRIGTTDPATPSFIAYAAFRCRIRIVGGATLFEKINGSQRTAGVIFPDTPVRSVLIGTEALGNETGFPAYGADAARDRIASVERVAADRWRLVFPHPSNGAVLEVMELIATR